jgi:FkbM family methyltransferase
MFQHQGIWLPDGEKHFPDWMSKNGEIVDGKGTYQIKKLRAALEHVRGWTTAIDVGGHVGLWSMHLARRFCNVFAYEPVRAYRDCFMRNVDPGDWDGRAIAEGWGRGGEKCNVELFPYALGRVPGRVRMTIPKLDGGLDTGGTHVGPDGEEVDMRRLDDEFQCVAGAVDFIKLDCEGYEHEVIAGAEKLIQAARPTIIVEQKPHKLGPNFGIKGTPAVDLLKSWGYVVRREISGDYILTAA